MGPEEGDRGEVAKSAVQIQRNARRSRPCMPDTQLAGLVQSDAGRRILTGDGEGALAGMRVGAVLHPSGCIHCYGVISGSLSG
ncbi:hypothetical protein SAMN05443247_11645 [Bradyrhizobium erythrophlei]|nr:hypothetical protein SAMN05443247_11645 [Bradyrhizobium erythrophlei]